jgi:CRISPR-associated protein (TIGR02710 family)
MDTKLMIMSLGGSIEPLKKSIQMHKPACIVFLASHDSIALSGEILKSIEYKPSTWYEITEDPNVMYECYKAARRCSERTKKMHLGPANVIVDYTGGTKVMTAALILATIGEPFRFNYVGGTSAASRNKDGLGTVMDGHEKMYPEMSPWSIFAEEERRQIVTLFNGRRFAAAVNIIDLCTGELPFQIKSYFSFVRPIADGFLLWEQFNHTAASRRFDIGLAALSDYLKDHPEPTLESFAHNFVRCQAFLRSVLEQSNQLKNLHIILVEDLLNNARRRMMDKRYDDATARSYRSLELFGQICFRDVAGCSTDEVKPEMVPDELRDDFTRKYSDGKGRTLKLPLTATFLFLKHKGHEAGGRYFEMEAEIKKITHSRNYSILAHGINPISENACKSIFETVSRFVGIENFFDFPQLP